MSLAYKYMSTMQNPDGFKNGSVACLWNDNIGKAMPSILENMYGRLVKNLSNESGAETALDTFKSNYDYLLREPDGVDKITNVLVRENSNFVTSELSSVVDLAYATKLHQQLFNIIDVKTVHAAQKFNPQLIHQNMSQMSIVRKYTSEDIGACIVVPGSTVEAVEILLHGKDNTIQPLLGQHGDPGGQFDQQRAAKLEQYCKLVLRAIESESGALQLALQMGIVESLRRFIWHNAVPYTLTLMQDAYHTSMAESTNIMYEVTPLISRASQRNALFRSYADNVVRETFALTKDPSYLRRFVTAGLKCIHNADSDLDYDHTSYVETGWGSQIPIVGYLCLDTTTRDYLSSAFSQGTRKGLMTVRLHEELAYGVKEINGEKQIILLNPPKQFDNPMTTQMSGKTAAEMLARLFKGSPREKDHAAEIIHRAGAKLFEGDPDNRPYNGQGDGHQPIYSIKLDRPCEFLHRSEGAVLVDVVNESYNPAITPGSKVTSTNVHKRCEMMHVSIGDFDFQHPRLTTWCNMLLSKLERFDISLTTDMFGIKNVQMNTPDVSTAIHNFKPREILQAYLNPHLYDGSKLVEVLQMQKSSSDKLRDADKSLQAIGTLYEALWGDLNFRTRAHKFMEYVDKGYRFEHELGLLRLEASPFYDLIVVKKEEEEGYGRGGGYSQQHISSEDMVCKYVKRPVVGAIPNYVIREESHIRRGLLILPRTLQLLDRMYCLADFLQNAVKKLISQNRTATLEPKVTPSDEDKRRFGFDNNLTLTWDIDKGNSWSTAAQQLTHSLWQLHSSVFPSDKKCSLLVNEQHVFWYVVMPVITNLYTDVNRMNLSQRQLTWKETTVPEDIFPEPSSGSGLLAKLYLQHNVYNIIKRVDLNIIHKMTTIFMMYRPNSITALKSDIFAHVPTGLTVDFFKRYDITSHDIYFTKPHTINSIITPLPRQVQGSKTKDCTIESKVNISCINNAFGPPALMCMTAIPDVDIAPASHHTEHVPRIAMDFITRTRRNLTDTLSSMPSLEQEDKDELLQELENKQAEVNTLKESEAITLIPEDAYVAIVRPSRHHSCNMMPFLGVPRHEGVGETSAEAFFNFFRSETETINPFMSNLCGIYAQTYMRSSMKLQGTSSMSSFDPITLQMDDEPPCNTTILFEEAFNFPHFHLAMFSEVENKSLHNWFFLKGGRAPAGGRVPSQLPYVAFDGKLGGTGLLLEYLNVPCRLSYSVPTTFYTAGMDRQKHFNINFKPNGDFIAGDNLSEFLIVSPYRSHNTDITYARAGDVKVPHLKKAND